MESRRSLRTLLGSWIAYWTVLGVTTLGPACLAIWRATRGPPGEGTVSVNYGNGAFNLIVTGHGQQTFSGSVTLLALALWVAGPPLLAWFAWLFLSRKAQRSGEKASG